MKKTSILILALSLLLPLLVYWVLGGIWAYDTNLWYESGKIADEQGLLNVYRIESTMPAIFTSGYFIFPLPWLVIVELTYKFAVVMSLDKVGFAYAIRFLPVLALELSTLLLFIYVRRKQGELTAAVAAFIYAVVLGVVNWLAVFVIGQIDPIPIFFTLLALVLADRKRMDWAMLALGVGAAIKIYPLIIAVAFLVREMREGKGRLQQIAGYALLAFVPLALVSLPPLIHDVGAYVEALTLYRNWVGGATIYYWIYALLGLEPYLWYESSVPAGAPMQLVPLIGIISLFLMLAGLLLGYVKLWRKNSDLVDAMLLSLLALFGFGKFIHINFLPWVLPFAVIQAFSPRRSWAGLIWIFVVFHISINSFSEPSTILEPFAQLAAIVYYLDLLRR